MSGGVVRLIEQRKKTNAYYDSMNATIADRKRTQQIANFEVSTTKKIERKMKEVWLCAFNAAERTILYCYDIFSPYRNVFKSCAESKRPPC